MRTASQTDMNTPEGWKAELTLALVIYQYGLPVCRQSSTHPDNNHLIATRPDLAIASPTS